VRQLLVLTSPGTTRDLKGAKAVYPLTPIKVYVLDRVQDNPAAAARVGRMLDALGYPPKDVVCITEQNLPDTVTELQTLWPPEVVPAGQVRTFMRPLVFTMQELGDEPPDLQPLLQRCPEGTPEGMVRNIMGQFDRVRRYHEREDDEKRNLVCWPTNDFGTMTGCPHGCHYCGEGKNGKFITLAATTSRSSPKTASSICSRASWLITKGVMATSIPRAPTWIGSRSCRIETASSASGA
jgi:hypothetical protein